MCITLGSRFKKQPPNLKERKILGKDGGPPLAEAGTPIESREVADAGCVECHAKETA